MKGFASLVWGLNPHGFGMDSKKASSLPSIAETLQPAEKGEEVDEMCRFVGCRERKVWTRTVLCRRICQVVACVVGDRGEETCRKLWGAILRLIVSAIVIVISGGLML